MNKEEERIEQQAMQLTTAIALPMALKAAMELGLFEIIDKGGEGARLSSYEIATCLLPNQQHDKLLRASQMIDRILRLLSANSVVDCNIVVVDHVDVGVERVYSLAPLSRYFMKGQDEHSIVAPLFAMIHDKVMLDVWHYLKDAIMEGEVPFNKAHGIDAKEYMARDERFGPIFSNSLKDFNSMFMEKVLNVYSGFEDRKVIVDVGGGNGSILQAIMSKYPTVRGINFDLRPIIEKLPSYTGIEHVAGDMFTSIPKGDAIFMKWVLKNLDDKQSMEVLKNCYSALPDDGKLMIVELVLPEKPDTSINSKSVFQFDVFLTNVNAWGKERTTTEFECLAKIAGFSRIQTMVRAYDFTLLEFHKVATKEY